MAEEDLSIYSQITEVKENTKVTKVIMVRHAESFANTEGKYQGQTYDTPLSDLGKKQARALAGRLKNFGIKRIIASPLKRTHQTASEVAQAINCTIEVSSAIIETNHGNWEGKHKDWISQNYPDIFDMWLKFPGEVAFPNGELFIETTKRTLDFLQNTHFTNDTLVVTHDNIVRAAISLISNLDINNMWDIPLETASINIFEVNRVNGKNLFRVLKLNDVDHLVGVRNSVLKHAL